MSIPMNQTTPNGSNAQFSETQMATSPPGRHPNGLHDLVVQAALRSYEIDGKEAVPYWRGSSNGHAVPDLVIPSLRRVEEIETEESLSESIEQRLDALVATGMEVWVLVPILKLGESRDRLRGRAHHVQSWWMEDRRIYFGRPESL